MGLLQHKVFKLKDFTKATSKICFLLSAHLINFRNIDICMCVHTHTHTHIYFIYRWKKQAPKFQLNIQVF